MRIIDKLIPFLSISLSAAVMAQLPFFLQRFKPKQGLLGSASSSYPSLFNPLSSSSILSPTYSSMASLLGAASNNFGSSLPLGYSSFGSSSLGSLGLGSSSLPASFGSSSLGSLGLGSSPLPAATFGSLSFAPQSFGSSSFSPQSFGSSSFSPQSFGSASFLPQNFGGSSYSPSNFGSSSYSPSNGASSFSSSGAGSPFFSSASFTPPSSGYSPFASATYNSPSILGSSSVGQKFEPSTFASSDFGHSGNFDGLGAIDPIDLIDDYPGFSNAGFGKDLNFAGSQPVKFHAPSTLGNEYNSYLKRSSSKK